MEHSAILSTSIKLLLVIKIFILSIFELPFYIGLLYMRIGYRSYITIIRELSGNERSE